MMENAMYISIGVLIVFYFLYKMFNAPPSYINEVEDVLANEEYKVKGRFE